MCVKRVRNWVSSDNVDGPGMRATLLEPDKPWFITYDLEFHDDGEIIDLISLSMRSGDGRSIYAINREMNQTNILNHTWLRQNVWPHLPLKDLPASEGDRGQYTRKVCACQPISGTDGKRTNQYTCFHMNGRLDMDHPDVRPLGQIRRLVSDFIEASHPLGPDLHRDNVKLWAWYGAYDHVRLAQLWGPMINLPGHIPMLTHDLKSEAMRLGNPEMPKQFGKVHDAAADTLHNMKKAWLLWQIATGQEPPKEK